MRRSWAVVKIYGLLILALGALMLIMVENAQASDRVVQPAHGLANQSISADPLLPLSVFTCTLTTTGTDSLPAPHYDFANAQAPNPTNTGLNLAPGTPGLVVAHEDFFRLDSVVSGNIYTFDAVPDGASNYNLGAILYNSAQSPIFTDTNNLDNINAHASLVLTTSEPYYARIFQLTPGCSGGTYHFNIVSTGPTATPTLTPTLTKTPTPTRTITPTPPPFGCQIGIDDFEPNNDFESATTIGLGVKYGTTKALNFVQCTYDDGSWDNDFLKVRVKPGMLITCKTSALSAGTDTNLILYDENHNGINGSDDLNRAGGDLSSAVTYYVTYEGWLYALVGQGFNVPQNLEASYTYNFECAIGNLSTDTPTPTNTPAGPVEPTRTRIPTDTPTPTITPTPTPPFIQIQPLPTATPVGLPLTRIPISLQVYYDADGNNKQDPGEGVSGVSVRIFDLVTGNLLTQGFTDETGRATFTVSAPGAVHLVVPYFNFSTIVLPSGGSAVIRISPRELPQSIP